MRVTLHTDYSLRMLMMLSVSGGPSITVQDVADRYRLSKNHLLKVALRLKNMGLIHTARGRSGGISLAVDPASVNIGTLIRKLEDGRAPVECMRPDGGNCILRPACRLKGVMHEALKAYFEVFDKYSLADLTSDGETLQGLLSLSSFHAKNSKADEGVVTAC